MTRFAARSSTTAAIAVLVLAGCGGGSTGDATVETPASPASSVDVGAELDGVRIDVRRDPG